MSVLMGLILTNSGASQQLYAYNKMSRRQDYIARIRYQNDLPPPQCPPKQLKTSIKVAKLATSSYLSDAVRKYGLTSLDDTGDLGMPLNMAIVPGIFDRGDESAVYPDAAPGEAEGEVANLDPEDQALLVSGDMSSTASALSTANISINGRSKPGVSFLRRTEYISSEAVRQKHSATKRKFESQILKPQDQLAAVEATFDAVAQDNKASLRHPRNKNLTAVETYPIFPDAKMFDLVYLSVRLVGSASLKTNKQYQDEVVLDANALSTSIFRRNVVGVEEWMSFFTSSTPESASELRASLNSTEDTSPDEDKVYEMTRVQDNDVVLHVNEDSLAEVAIEMTADGRALYVPIAGRTNLKRRRVMKVKKEIVEEQIFDRIELKLRDITAEESIVRDNLRNQYDPILYKYTEEEEDEDEEVAEAVSASD